MKLFEYNSYHFIGIGGIGVSAIARMLHLKGKKISGSDSGKSEIIEDLEKLGIKIYIGQDKENIKEDKKTLTIDSFLLLVISTIMNCEDPKAHILS